MPLAPSYDDGIKLGQPPPAFRPVCYSTTPSMPVCYCTPAGQAHRQYDIMDKKRNVADSASNGSKSRFFFGVFIAPHLGETFSPVRVLHTLPLWGEACHHRSCRPLGGHVSGGFQYGAEMMSISGTTRSNNASSRDTVWQNDRENDTWKHCTR